MAATDDIIAKLRVRLEDIASPFKFDSVTLLVPLLNDAQDRLINLLDDRYLSQLLEIDENVTPTSDAIVLSTLSPNIFNSRIVTMRMYNSPYTWYRKISFDDIQKSRLTVFQGSDTDPQFYLFNNQINIMTETADVVADVYYLKVPLALAVGTGCELDVALYDILVTLAAALVWESDDKGGRAGKAFTTAYDMIKLMNSNQG